MTFSNFKKEEVSSIRLSVLLHARGKGVQEIGSNCLFWRMAELVLTWIIGASSAYHVNPA